MSLFLRRNFTRYSSKMRSKPRKKDSGIQDSEKHDYNPVDGSKDLRMTSPDSR